MRLFHVYLSCHFSYSLRVSLALPILNRVGLRETELGRGVVYFLGYQSMENGITPGTHSSAGRSLWNAQCQTR